MKVNVYERNRDNKDYLRFTIEEDGETSRLFNVTIIDWRSGEVETVETLEWAIIWLMHEIAPNLWKGSKYLWEGEQ